MKKEELRKLRLKHGLTQKAMAELLSVTPNYVSRLERETDIDTPVSQRVEKLVHLIFREKKAKNI